jgi:processive rubber oxygenase RoxA-like protein/cytochrome c
MGEYMNRFEAKLPRLLILMLAALFLVCGIDPSRAQSTPGSPPNPQLTYAEQGWSAADRDVFYTTSQGSRMMPYDWFKALRRLDVDELFGGDQLQRYGYLANERPTNNLPIGFVIDDRTTPNQLGMTCAACHTGQLEYQKDGVTRRLRIDGAPANADFQLFLTELTAAARETSKDPQRFDGFAKAVLGSNFSVTGAAALKVEFDAWVVQFGEFMDKSLPASSPWGPGRLDAFNMIFNRVAVRGLGLPQNFVIADAPTSYPFLWNASRQDHTQWTGSVANGLYIHALARNTGEVFGVFGQFSPKRIPTIPPLAPIILYDDNSADFSGLQTLEEKIAALKPPPWPRGVFPIDDALAARGKPLFEANCSGCHGEKQSDLVPPPAWATSVQAVGTDAKMATNAAKRTVDSGLLNGALLPKPPGAQLTNPAHATDILANSVVGSLIAGTLKGESGIQRAFLLDLATKGVSQQIDPLDKAKFLKDNLDDLFRVPPTVPDGAYESRVLHGIWATAPYLHNGSVPNLWELLTPPKDRKPAFMVGSRMFDPKNVGYATDQSPFKNGNFTADPANANGNGNGGHIAGTTLSDDDRWALIEYLKTL